MRLLKNRDSKKHQLPNVKYSLLQRDGHVIMIIMIIITTDFRPRREKSRIRPKRDKEITVV